MEKGYQGTTFGNSAIRDGSISFTRPEMKRLSLDKADVCKSFYSSNKALREEY
jgi:hypothetical protein